MSLVTGSDPAMDAARLAGLKRMRLIALSLLVAAAVIFLATLGRDGFWGFVNAGAEASMVGAMADWFAVTALFRHPMGIPIPHTALIPRRKDMLAQSLQDFMSGNFLRPEIIRDRVLAARISNRISAWVLEPANADRVIAEGSLVATRLLERIDDDDVRQVVREAVLPRLREEQVSPIAGSLLGEVVADKAHYGLVDLALTEMNRWLLENEDVFTGLLLERAPWWAPPRVNDMVVRRIHAEALAWVRDVMADPQHRIRIALDGLLTQLASDLQTDPATQERAERLKNRLLEHPQTLETALDLWRAGRTTVIRSLADPTGALPERLRFHLVDFAARVRDEPDLQGRLDGYAADAAVFATTRYGSELTQVISHTINRWDGRETADRVELYVGRDLQFIRINGTLVGGLVGIVIHTVVVLLGH